MSNGPVFGVIDRKNWLSVSGSAGELHAVEIVRPDADAELVEPELLVGRRLDRRLDHAAAGIATARLVDQ